MIIHSTQGTVEKSADIQEQGFRIKANKMAFKVLSSRMYSNKILAWVRETFCNSYDAHIAAGKRDVPIEVHLPNTLEPFFSVKDYGTGLSHENMMELYATYFESTKTNCPQSIGGLGLGSKAGLCYADSFMVTSRFNGTKRTYTAFINNDGLPSISLMGEEVTDEPNGLEVQGAVDTSDFYSFQSNARDFFRRVEPKPIFKGADVTVPDLANAV